MAPKRPRRPKKPPDPDDADVAKPAATGAKNKTRTRKRREGEVTAVELRSRIMEATGSTYKKSALAKKGKLELCEIARRHGLLDAKEFDASLARRSEGRKCYLWTLLREKKLRAPVDDYVRWWSQVFARGTMIADGFASATHIPLESLLDLTYLKKLLYPERYAVEEWPPGLSDWLNGITRRSSFATMLPVGDTLRSTTIGDQALTYMARRYRGNIKGHILTHVHSRLFQAFAARYHPLERRSEPGTRLKRALVEGVYDRLDVQEAWRVVAFRQWLGLDDLDIVGHPIAQPMEEEDEMLAEVAGDGDQDEEGGDADSSFQSAWAVHSRLCERGVTTMLPLASLSRQHAMLDGRIVYYIVRRFNRTVGTAVRTSG